jgi:hypothetical protein
MIQNQFATGKAKAFGSAQSPHDGDKFFVDHLGFLMIGWYGYRAYRSRRVAKSVARDFVGIGVLRGDAVRQQ